jgi:hypothetical protein
MDSYSDLETLASLVEFKEKMILLNMCFPLGMGYIYHG